MNGSEVMIALLHPSSPSIAASVDTYKGTPAIFFDNQIPQEIPVNGKTINFNLSTPTGDTSEIPIYRYIMSCRAGTLEAAAWISNNVVNEINRRSYGNFVLYASFLPTVPPANERDNYNSPLEVTSVNKLT